MNTAKNKRLNYLLNQAITIFDLLDISPVLAEILSLSEVKLDDEAKTAHISKGKNGYSIKFSPEFFKVCDYPYKFAGVLLHEIFHGFYRDFTRFKIIKPVVNLGMDAIINSTIHRLDPRLTKIFSDFYSADRFPEQFLRPGSNPKGEGEIRIYNLLWTDQDIGITLDDLIIFFNQRISWNTDVIFLGTHGDRLEKIPYSKTIIDGVKARIGGENKFSEHISEQIVDKSNKIPSCSVSLNQIFKYAAGSTTTNNHYYYNTIVPKTLKLHKKDLLCLSQNIWPLYFKESGNRSKVHLYLDVSASVKYLLPGLYEMLKRYNKFLCRKIYLFSNDVSEISKKELLENRVKTTGGTDYTVVCNHILNNRIQKALIITDGHAKVEKELARKVRRRHEVICLLTEDNPNSPVYQFCRKVFNGNL